MWPARTKETHAVSGIPRDVKTAAYFDEQVHDYSVGRLSFAAEAIARRADAGASLLDIGCGTGNTLQYLGQAAGIEDLYGIDVSATCLETVRERIGCPVWHGSVLDDDLVERVGRRFDFVVLAAVLHHLIGPTRRASKGYASLAVHRGLDLLEPDGHLVVHEPIFYPRAAMDGVFYVKKALTGITSRRVELGGTWNNIGAPVVSYLTNEELIRMVEADGRAEIVEQEIVPDDSVSLSSLISKTNTTLVARKR
jgi:2-polyprenyl-3-methyl-5-hydroxy-6-metoxy-1,4-benzoquinol methylase